MSASCPGESLSDRACPFELFIRPAMYVPVEYNKQYIHYLLFHSGAALSDVGPSDYLPNQIASSRAPHHTTTPHLLSGRRCSAVLRTTSLSRPSQYSCYLPSSPCPVSASPSFTRIARLARRSDASIKAAAAGILQMSPKTRRRKRRTIRWSPRLQVALRRARQALRHRHLRCQVH